MLCQALPLSLPGKLLLRILDSSIAITLAGLLTTPCPLAPEGVELA